MYNINGNIQQQLAQNRMAQLESQYNGYNPYMQAMNQNQQYMQVPQMQQVAQVRGRPVSNIEEARASMIDLDGSLFVFPNVSNGEIYTKQIMLDGTAEFKVYKTEQVQKQEQNSNSEYVLKSEFEQAINELRKEFENEQCISE